MDMKSFFESEFAEHELVIANAKVALYERFSSLVATTISCLERGGKILLFGNGGSAADAQHLSTELVVRYKSSRRALAAIALTTDTSALTAIGNDFDFEQIFARQIEALGRKGDMAIGLSTSGRSPNVLQALKTARRNDLVTVGFGGGSGGNLHEVSDHLLIVPSFVTARIQEVHLLVGHMLCAAIDAAFASD